MEASSVGKDEEELSHGDLATSAQLGGAIDELNYELPEAGGGEERVGFLYVSEVEVDEPVGW